MDTTPTPTVPEKSLKTLSAVVPTRLAHEARCAAAHAGLSLSKWVRSLIEAAVACETTTLNSAEPVAVDPSTDDALVAAAE